MPVHETASPPRSETNGFPSGLPGAIGRFIFRGRSSPTSAITILPIEEAQSNPIGHNRADLERFLQARDLLGTDRDPATSFMATPITKLPRIAAPEELTIVRIGPDDKQAAADYHAVAARNLDPSHCPVPYAGGRDETNYSYYVGYVAKPGEAPAPASTLMVVDFAGRGDVAILDNVTTLEGFRGPGYAATMISNVLADSDYTVAFLSSTPKGRGLYEHLGFAPVG